ncbi:cytochrome ubiquinol oxidase subunit I [Rarobacter faecitabidus]|uniref:Cytochrome bd-I ubiquinol oxidase subunit 1 apoprotein n=1 Tax=Rarobacter faecitabidus TaxID=13243 RepID=A0A542ZV90_RARFA|nr:cytochrome ubiquinol oxidase subunit I [Rarobacter faecitabidus]TQL64100.1 cytochrome bd-I ubiquinol oxidase subunit 1 apoprotein [Rarobacter faecitabidus]
MDVLDLARWQFAITTVYHFIFVPLTIGLAPLVAVMQTAWVRTGDEKWLKLTKFFGKLLLINFALGVATGIVQEFQFGMAWSEYSRFVGDVFGAPLAMEALAAFFIESTFLGLWIFGWDKLPKKLHLAMIWAVAIAVNLSALFILAANSWMQHPVGATVNPETGRAEMNSIGDVLTNNTLWAAFPHTVTAAFLTAGTFVAGICAWWMVKKVRSGKAEDKAFAKSVYRTGLRFGCWVMIVAGVGIILTGDMQAKLMFEQQPMKMAAAEALCHTEEGAAFSILTIGDLNNDCEGVRRLISIPGATSFLANGDFNSTLKGVNELQSDYEAKFGYTDEAGNPISYSPNLAVTYWSFRLMIGFAAGSVALALAGLWLTRKGRISDNPWLSRIGLIAIPTPFLASSFGWIFTEIGRQPWVVAPNPTGVDGVWLLTQRGVSPIAPWLVLTSMIVFTLLYGVLAVVWYRLMHRYTVEGAPEIVEDVSPQRIGGRPAGSDEDDGPLSFAY